MKKNKKKHESILIVAILFCACASMVFNVLLVKNALSCRRLLKQAEVLAQRADAVKEAAKAVAVSYTHLTLPTT